MSSPAAALHGSATESNAAKRVRDVLSTARTAVVCGHVNPDGDALGSAFAMAQALDQQGIDAQVTWGGVDAITPPAPLDPALAFLTAGATPTAADRVHADPDVVICCDTAAPSRLGTLQPLLARAATVVVIDHHAVGEEFGDLRLVDPDASSTGALVLDLVRQLGVVITPAIADALYLAILTDTGRFSYPSTQPSDLRAAADLIEAGADHTGIARAVYASASRGFIPLVARVTGRAVVEPDLSWSYTTQDDLAATGADEAENDGLIDLLRTVRDVSVSLFMRETPAGGWRCSLRSAGQVDVAAIAAELGGGGHRRAAGFSHGGAPAQIAERVRTLMAAEGQP